MDFIFDNIQYIGIVVFAFIAWLNKRSQDRAEAADAERAREEMIRGMEELARSEPQRRQQRATPPPIKPSAPPGQAPPPLTPHHADPFTAPSTKTKPDPYQIDAGHGHTDPLARMQQQIAEAREQQEEARKMAEKAREKRRQVEGAPGSKHRRTGVSETPGLKSILADPRQSRRAIVLREILGPPVALRQ